MSETRHFDYIVVGGGIAGTTAAETIRRNEPFASIAICEAENEYLYSRVMLPSFIRGKYGKERLFLRTKNDYDRQQITLFRDTQIASLDAERKEIEIYLLGETAFLHYGKLLLATGGYPKNLDLEIPQQLPTFSLQTLADAEAIKVFIERGKMTNTVVGVIGGGFIGLEFIESFITAGFTVHVLLRDGGFFSGRVSEEFRAILEDIHRGRSIVVHHNATITADIQQNKEKNKAGAYDPFLYHVICSNGEKISVHALAFGVGIERRNNLAASAKLSVRRGIFVDQFFQTTNEHVFAAGDVAEYLSEHARDRVVMGNWSAATTQGMIVGGNMTGEKKTFDQLPVYAINHFGNHIAFVGINHAAAEKTVIRKKQNMQYAEFYFKDGILKGATIVNYPALVGLLVRTIKAGTFSLTECEQLEDQNNALEEIFSTT